MLIILALYVAWDVKQNDQLEVLLVIKYSKNALYIRFVNEEKAEVIEGPIYVMRQKKNNINIQCNIVHAQGVISADGSTIYQFEDKPVMDSSYPVVKKFTYAEFCEMQVADKDYDPDDPEITDEEALNIIMGDIVE